MRTSTILKAAAASLVMLAASATWAAAPAGTVLYVAGKMTAEGADGKSRELQRRSEVFAGDLLKTDSGARAQVRFTDGSIVALKPGSELKLDQYSYAGPKAGGESVMSLLKGGFRTMTGAISQVNKQAYKVNTPVATIGVRGTLYETALSEDGLNLGVWDGGITACGEGGCIDLGMNSDFSFGFVPVGGGKPTGSQQQPDDIGEASAGDDGDGDGDVAFLGDAGAVDSDDFRHFDMLPTASRAAYSKVGFAVFYDSGVVAANHSKASSFFNGSFYDLLDWSLVDDASGIELSADNSYCMDCSHWYGSTQYDMSAEMNWGDWTTVNVGMYPGDTSPLVSASGGGFVMADYISPADVMAWGSANSTLSVYTGFGGSFASEGGVALSPGSIGGNMFVDFMSGAVNGNFWVPGNDGSWSINYTGVVAGGELSPMTIDAATSTFTSGSTSLMAPISGTVQGSFYGAAGEVLGVVGGVEATTVNPDTLSTELLQAVFMMSVNAG